jgi:Arc/MetJ family transcription regulator
MLDFRSVRTTITLDDDVSAAVERLRRERDLGLSEAVNELIRAGLSVRPRKRRFQQKSEPIGLRIDVTNVAEALELAEGPDYP